MADQHTSANNTRDTKIEIPTTEDGGEDHHQYFDGRRMHRVPELVRFNKHKEEDCYAPKLVSLGPNYHGLSELRMAENIKQKVLAMFVSVSGKDRQFFYCHIFKVIGQIRNCYAEDFKDKYVDCVLAEMMLLDASFAIYLMKTFVRDQRCVIHFRKHFGIALEPFAFRDLGLLDNQIPLWVTELLIHLIDGNQEAGPMLIRKFLSYTLLPNGVEISITGEDIKQPLHLVDAYHQLLAPESDNAGKRKNIKFKSKCLWWLQRKENQYEFGDDDHQSRSVTDLKAKGVHLKASSYCLKNIKFESYTFHGQLQLPVWLFTTDSKQFFTQMVAYEALPESNVGTPIICYINFLKSLVVKSEDVKELREKKILFSTLDNDEQVVEIIKGIDTCGLEDDYIFNDVKKRIEKHCRSKGKTWIADLIHTYFHNPWTCIALVAATIIFFLTFLQTHFTIYPLK